MAPGSTIHTCCGLKTFSDCAWRRTVTCSEASVGGKLKLQWMRRVFSSHHHNRTTLLNGLRRQLRLQLYESWITIKSALRRQLLYNHSLTTAQFVNCPVENFEQVCHLKVKGDESCLYINGREDECFFSWSQGVVPHKVLIFHFWILKIVLFWVKWSFKNVSY